MWVFSAYICNNSWRVIPRSMLTISGRGVITSLTCWSPNLKTFSSISASAGSTVPSASPISIIERISPSVTVSSESFLPNKFWVILESHCKNKMAGNRAISRLFSGRA